MMKRFLLLPILLSVINILPISAQVFTIPANTANVCRDYNGTSMTLPMAMRFEVISATDKTVQVGTTASPYSALEQAWVGDLVVPSSVKYNNVWYNVTQIGTRAFDIGNGYGFKSIKLHVKKLSTIGQYAFVSGLAENTATSVDIKTDVKLTIETGAFGKTSMSGDLRVLNQKRYLEDVFIQSNGLHVGRGAFQGNLTLQRIDIKSTDKMYFDYDAFHQGVNIGGSFINCLPRQYDRLTQNDYIRITGPVDKIGYKSFCNIVNIKEVTINDGRTDSKTGGADIGQEAFENLFCGSGSIGKFTVKGAIKKLALALYFPTESYVDFGSGIGKKNYYNCLTDIDVANTGEDPMTMHYIFSDCFFYDEKNTAPATVKVRGHISSFGNYVRGENTSVVNGTRLRNFEIENCNLSTNASLELEPTLFNQGFNKMMVMSSSTLSKDAAFNKVPGTLTIKGPVKDIPTVYFEDNSALSHVTVRTPVSSPLRIKDGAFRNCFRYDTDGTVNISGDISYIHNEAFYAPTNLMTVTIDNTKGTYDLSIGTNAFRHGFKRNAANADGGLINISGKIYYIGKNSFADATYLNTVDIANGRSDKPLTIKIGAFRNAFRHADSGIVTLGGNLAAIEDSAFYAPTNLNKLTIVNTAGTSNLTIGKRAFMNGFRHASRGVMMMEGKLQTIADSAFYAPTNLNSVAITNTAGTSNLTIGERAFMNGFRYDANGTVNIAGNVSRIGTSAFYAPTNLNSLTINNTSTTPLTIGTTAFDKGFRRTGTVGGKVDIKGNLKEIGQYAIAAAHGLNDISIDNTTGSGDLTIVAGAFRDGITFDNGSINPTAGKLVIKGKLASIGDQAFSYLSSNTYKGNLTNVTINNTGTTDLTIAKNAFNRQYSRDVKGVLSISGKLKEIGEQAFYSTPNLMNVQISNGTSTADLIIGKSAFHEAYKRNEAGGIFKLDGKLSKLNTQTFKDATYLNTVTILNGQSAGHLVIDKYAFQNCFRHDSHGAVTLTGKLLTIGDSAFVAPTNLMTVAIDNTAGTSNLTIGASAFRHGFKRSAGTAGSVTIKGKLAAINAYAFEYPTNLMSVDIQNTGTANLTIANQAFPEGFRRNATGGKVSITGRLTSIGKWAFNNNTYMQTVTIDNTGSTADLEIAEQAFQTGFRHDSNGALTITGRVKSIGEKAFNAGTNLMNVNITHTASANHLSIGASAFYNTFLRTSSPTGTLTMNGKLASIGKDAFHYTRALKTVSITNSGTNTAVIDTMAFRESLGCKKASSAFETLFEDGSFTYSGPLKELGYQAFYDAYGLKTVTLNTTTEYRIMDMCFRYNRSLSELNSNNGSTKRSIPSMVRYIGSYAFHNTGFTEMTIPDLTLKPSWNPNITESNPMKQTLINQGKGDELYPASSTAHDWYNINGNFGDYIFADCRNLQKVTINSTTTGGRAVFRNCKELTDVTLGSKVRFIEQYSFEGCTKLDHLFVPKTVSLIGTGIMYRGAPAHRITFEGTQPPHAVSNAFNGNKPNLVVPKGSVSSYLFSADNLGFQQVAADNISCEYTLASSGWGSLGMQAHKIKEYKATVNAGRVEWLSVVDDRGTFTDVYDTRRIGVTNADGIVTDVAPSDAVNIYTADYYYPVTKKVGIDKIENFAIVPQNTSTTNRHIGYLVEGEGGMTYYLHHYTGGDMSSKIAANGETYSYGTVRDAAKSAFDSEDIPCPGAFGGSTYSRTDAPNLLIAYTGTTYTQGQNLVIDGGKYFGTEPCYYYGFAGGQFRKINGWSNFKEGNAFIAIPKRLMDESAAGKEVLSFFLMDNGDGDDWKTTGIDDLNNDGRHIEGGRDEWYTIDGIKLTERPTKKGLYIHNGRKEAIR